MLIWISVFVTKDFICKRYQNYKISYFNLNIDEDDAAIHNIQWLLNIWWSVTKYENHF